MGAHLCISRETRNNNVCRFCNIRGRSLADKRRLFFISTWLVSLRVGIGLRPRKAPARLAIRPEDQRCEDWLGSPEEGQRKEAGKEQQRGGKITMTRERAPGRDTRCAFISSLWVGAGKNL
jgi:hypothetical protein